MHDRLGGMICLVTGASNSIGHATARKLAKPYENEAVKYLGNRADRFATETAREHGFLMMGACHAGMAAD